MDCAAQRRVLLNGRTRKLISIESTFIQRVLRLTCVYLVSCISSFFCHWRFLFCIFGFCVSGAYAIAIVRAPLMDRVRQSHRRCASPGFLVRARRLLDELGTSQ